jgi:hypothetical protein
MPSASDAPFELNPEGRDLSPFDRGLGDIAPRIFSGDNFEKAHLILRDKIGYLSSHAAKLPDLREPQRVVIIGGGISGLTAAYLLRAYRPIVLEKSSRLGGNSQGQSWKGIDYSIGAAYFTEPDKGSPLAELLFEDLKIHKKCRYKSELDPVMFGGNLMGNFWEGASDPTAREKFTSVASYLQEVLKADGGKQFPEIPAYRTDGRELVNELDRLNLVEHLTATLGGALHPHVAAYLDRYCWACFGAGADEISAAAGLNFLAAEWGGIYVPRGGNAAVSSTLVDRLMTVLPPNSLRPSSLVIDVKVTDEGVRVLYEDVRGGFHYVDAEVVVMACPKFVCGKVLDDIEPERRHAIDSVRYRGYIVGNACLQKKIEPQFADCYLVSEAKESEGFTDATLATYAHPDPERTVVTLYWPLPLDAGRASLLAHDAYESHRLALEKRFFTKFLPTFGISEREVTDFRLARWGHALPVCRPNAIAEGTVDRLSAPFRERVFFVEQDNWLLPCLETAVQEALHWAPEIARRL